jgi:hypothetical protein
MDSHFIEHVHKNGVNAKVTWFSDAYGASTFPPIGLGRVIATDLRMGIGELSAARFVADKMAHFDGTCAPWPDRDPRLDSIAAPPTR